MIDVLFMKTKSMRHPTRHLLSSSFTMDKNLGLAVF
jgi:hypothetical protein